MEETTREPAHEAPGNDERGGGAQGGAPGPAHGAAPDAAQGQAWRGDARRRRGRRGRGGRPMGPPLPGASQPREDEEPSSQMRELAAYERRQRASQQRGPWRGPSGGGFRPQGAAGRPQFGAPRPYGQRPGGSGFRPQGGPRQQRYQEMVRRATAGPRSGPVEEGGEPISGPHAVLEALRANRPIRRIFIAQERGVRTGAANDLVREAQERRIPVRFVDRIDVERLSPGVEHQGVVAIAEGRHGVELDEMLLHLDTLTDPPLLLIIDSLQDPQNFGVLLRSAEGAGVDGVVIPRHRQVGLTPAVTRTSAGASEHLMIADVANLRQAIDALRERGVWVVGTDDSGEMEWDEVDYRGATAVVVGGEGEGIRRLVLEGCDQVVRITMRGQVSSLNAAAAGTVVLFEALRQRMRDAAPPLVERPERPASSAEGEAAEGSPEPADEELAEFSEAEDEAAHTSEELATEETPETEPLEGAEAVADAPKPKRAPRKTAAKTTKTTAKRAPRKKAETD